MEIRSNKTNFGLSFGHFRSKNVKKRGEERRREEEEEEKEEEEEEERYETRILYRNHVFVWIHDFEYGNFEYGSVCMDISGSIFRV